MEKCFALKKKPQRDKIEFLKAKGACFRCLKLGHLSKECENCLICDVCGEKHPTILHIYRKETTVKEPEEKHELVFAQTLCHTGARNERSVMPIIPVQVKSTKGNTLMLTYAFLDEGSSATFCADRLMQELNLSGKKVNILFCTMGQEQSVSCSVIDGLEISGINSNDFFPLPSVYTQQKMPVNSENIVSQEELSKWPYLDRVKVPYIQAGVDLLIGNNASSVMEPYEIINSHGNKPFAVRTLLGWLVSGTTGSGHRNEAEHSAVTGNRISIVKLEELLQNHFNHDFSKRVVDKTEMSREDLWFTDIMNRSVIVQDGHYSLKLPFKTDVMLPDNICVAMQRVRGLKRKLERNQEFYERYTHFML